MDAFHTATPTTRGSRATSVGMSSILDTPMMSAQNAQEVSALLQRAIHLLEERSPASPLNSQATRRKKRSPSVCDACDTRKLIRHLMAVFRDDALTREWSDF
jgi:hypothetical protein